MRPYAWFYKTKDGREWHERMLNVRCGLVPYVENHRHAISVLRAAVDEQLVTLDAAYRLNGWIGFFDLAREMGL